MSKEAKPEKPIVYSAMEVAKICGVVNQTAINWIRNGYLKAFKTPGGQFRVYPDDLVVLMEKNGMKVPPEIRALCGKHGQKKAKSLLIVDDDRPWNDVMKKYFLSKDAELQVFQAFDGFEAGSVMAQKKPRVVILDLDLPGIDGVRILRTVKDSSESYGNPSIIVVTALDDRSVEDECKKLGVAIFCKKPVNLPDLADFIAKLYLK